MIFTLLQLLFISFIWGLIAAWLVYKAGYHIEPDPAQKALQQFLVGLFMPIISVIWVIILLRRYKKAESLRS